MLKMNYVNSSKTYDVNFKIISQNVVELIGDFPVKTDGFILSREEHEDNWDYSDYTTIYGEIEGGVHFSNDGSTRPEIISDTDIEYVPYIPTLSELQELKVVEMNTMQQSIIQQGIDVTLTDGTTEHFTLTDHDQTSLIGLQMQVAQGTELIPWHTSDQTEHCKFYSNADMALITTAAIKYVTWHVTYFRDLRIYIRELQDIEAVKNISYGINIPEEYQSEPLKAMITEGA